MSVVAIIY